MVEQKTHTYNFNEEDLYDIVFHGKENVQSEAFHEYVQSKSILNVMSGISVHLYLMENTSWYRKQIFPMVYINYVDGDFNELQILTFVQSLTSEMKDILMKDLWENEFNPHLEKNWEHKKFYEFVKRNTETFPFLVDV